MWIVPWIKYFRTCANTSYIIRILRYEALTSSFWFITYQINGKIPNIWCILYNPPRVMPEVTALCFLNGKQRYLSITRCISKGLCNLSSSLLFSQGVQQPGICFVNKGAHRLPDFNCIILYHCVIEQLHLTCKETELSVVFSPPCLWGVGSHWWDALLYLIASSGWLCRESCNVDGRLGMERLD